VQDLLGYIKRKPTEISSRTHKELLYIKDGILAIVILFCIVSAVTYALGVGQGFRGALGIFAQAPFETLSPAQTLFSTLPNIAFNARYTIPVWLAGDVLGNILTGIALMPPIFWVQFGILIAVIAIAIYVPRSWCRYFCPHGAAMGFLNKFSFLGLKREPVKCTKAECHACVEVCPMKVPILDLPWDKFTDPECIYCLKCVEACGTNAIKPKFP
jgi:ferredoxin